MMISSKSAVVLLAAVGPLAVNAAYFSIGHPQMLRTRLDPIISPNKVSGHVHAVIGSSAFTADASFASITAGNCTTSFIQADKSSYWVPQLYYKWKNGTFTAIQGDGIVAYWKYSGSDTFAVVPDDFRMVAGNMSRDYFDPNQASHQAISFECVGNGYDYKTWWIPSDLECPTIRPQAFFANCWNGVDAYKSDNSHVAYPTGNDYENGPCPDGYTRIPSLFMESYYHMSNLGPEYEWYPGCLVLATGDNNGFSYHADFMNGWPTGMLVDAYNQCDGAGNGLPGTVDGCSVFEASRDQAKADACYAAGDVINEPIGLQTPLTALPGNNPVYNSSRIANDPKVVDPNYQEKSSIVTITSEEQGGCEGIGARTCYDYTLPQGASSASISSPADSATGTSTAVLLSLPSSSLTSSSEAPTSTGDGEDDEETQVCTKVKRRSRARV